MDTFEEEEPVDMEEVARNIESIKKELREVEDEMAKYLKELGVINFLWTGGVNMFKY